MGTVKKNSFPFMADILLMLLPAAGLSCYYYGLSALRLLAVSCAVSVACDFLGSLLLSRTNPLADMSALVTGLCVALLLPASSPLWLAAFAAAFAIIVAKLPFGSFDEAPFVPAAAAIAFLSVCYPSRLFSYPAVFFAENGSTDSLASMLTQGNSINLTVPGVLNIMVGNVPGPMGAACAVFLVACLIYLLIRRPNSFIVAAGFTAVCCLFAVLFPRVLSGRQVSVVMEISGGMLLFTAVFLMTYPNVHFRSPLRALTYGLCGGTLCMLIRYFGVFEEGACFAVLFMNALGPVFEGKTFLLRSSDVGGDEQ